MLQIGTVKLANWLVMAPMAGYTNLAFRLVAKAQGAGLVTSEMISAAGLTRRQKKTIEYLKSVPAEKPLAVQIFGSSPETMARAAEIAVEAGADIVDINMGCPVKKVVKTGAGASLLRDLKQTSRIIRAVRHVCPVPLTAKIRLGWSRGKPVALETARMLQDCGVDALTIHPRFATDGFSAPADWEWIRKVKEHLKIPVIGNGDVMEAPTAIRMKKSTGCDGVMIGRGGLKKPWIFRQILRLEKGMPAPDPDLLERRNLVINHARLFREYMPEKRALHGILGPLMWYTKGLPNSAHFRESISRARDFDSLLGAVDRYFAELENVPAARYEAQ